MRKKEKSNREKKNGYAHDEWLRRKVERNLQKHQLYIYTRGTEENPIFDPHWEHLEGINPLRLNKLREEGRIIAVLVP